MNKKSKLLSILLSILALTSISTLRVAASEPWRFIVIADWHSAEKYTQSKNNPNLLKEAADNDVSYAKMIKNIYGGDLVMLPGDSNRGHWKTKEIMPKGRLCYGGMIKAFEKGGYNKLLMAVGDHELGDNPWPPDSAKSRDQNLFRKAFSAAFNKDSKGNFIFDKPIGTVPSRPIGTKYQETSFAVKHKNVLFVTVDVFRQDDPKKAIGGEGSVTGSVTGKHLEWLDAVFSEARKDNSIKHIFVQSHLPVIYPVRKVNSSGMLMDNDVESDFWKTLRKYKVDIYFAGEVHANTVTKDPESDLVQIVSRGNFFSNFLTVDVGNDELKVTCHNLSGTKSGNAKYAEIGHLSIRKLREGTSIKGDGNLALLDRKKPVVHFDFEKRFPLESRPVTGQSKRGIFKKIAVIENTECTESFANKGVFGQDYDAHFANIALVEGMEGKAGQFGPASRMAVFGMGPHYPGRQVSYSLWVKTASAKPMVLINSGSIWHDTANFMNLNLRGGRPEIMISKGQRLVADCVVNDGKWHHLAVSVDKNNAKLSEIPIYVDGNQVKTNLRGKDQILKSSQAVRISVGGFGYSKPSFRKLGVNRFKGSLDEVTIWARGLDQKDIKSLLER